MNLALFDLDNTLLAGDSDFEWAQFLICKGIVDREIQEAKNIEFYEHYKAGTLDIYEFLIFQLAPLTRHPRAELDAWHGEYLERHIRPIITAQARAKVSEHLAQIIEMVQVLVERGHAYVVERPDGQRDVYYSVRSFPDYGKLSRRRVDDLLDRSR